MKKPSAGLTINQFNDPQRWLLNIIEQQKAIITQLKAQNEELRTDNKQLKAEFDKLSSGLILADAEVRDVKTHHKSTKASKRLVSDQKTQSDQLDFKF